MILPDINVLIGAMREDSLQHYAAKKCLQDALAEGETLAWNSQFHAGLIRVVSHTRFGGGPSSIEDCFAFLDGLRRSFVCVPVVEGTKFWTLFRSTVEKSETSGARITDALVAALAMEHNARLITFDRDFLRFKNLRLELLSPEG